VDPLRLTTYHVVTPKQLQELRSLRNAYMRSSPTGNAPSDQVQLFDDHYKVGGTPGSLSYEINPEDEREILRSIRNGKLSADFMIATIHAHDGAQDINGVRTVSDFLIKIAHECIDNGADIFIVHGPHMLQGVEIYKGKPIFYGISAFVFQSDIQLSSSRKEFLNAPPDERPNCCALNHLPAEEGMLATSRYEGGGLWKYASSGGSGNRRVASYVQPGHSPDTVARDRATHPGRDANAVETVRDENRNRKRGWDHPRSSQLGGCSRHVKRVRLLFPRCVVPSAGQVFAAKPV
jgi:hypothetical protein